MVPKLRKKRLVVVVAAALSCNFYFPSLHLVRGLSFNDSPGHEGSQRLYLPFISLGLVLRIVLSLSTFRYALWVS